MLTSFEEETNRRSSKRAETVEVDVFKASHWSLSLVFAGSCYAFSNVEIISPIIVSFCHIHFHPSLSSHPPATPAPPHKPNYTAFTSPEMELPKICSSFKICLQSSHSSAVLPSQRQDILRKKEGDIGYQSFGLVFRGVLLIICPPPGPPRSPPVHGS